MEVLLAFQILVRIKLFLHENSEIITIEDKKVASILQKMRKKLQIVQ